MNILLKLFGKKTKPAPSEKMIVTANGCTASALTDLVAVQTQLNIALGKMDQMAKLHKTLGDGHRERAQAAEDRALRLSDKLEAMEKEKHAMRYRLLDAEARAAVLAHQNTALRYKINDLAAQFSARDELN